jgi:protein O-mannosyl-transferase
VRWETDASILAPALALSVTALAYTRCLGSGLVFDDNNMIVRNPLIGNWSFLWKSFAHDSWWFRNTEGGFPKSQYYRPLQDVWLGLNYHLFGLNTVGWHVAIVAMHLIVVYLVYRLALALIGGERWTAAVAAMLFGLMPVHAQAAVWPTAIPLSMSAAFEIGALLVFMKRASDPVRLGALAAALYACALLSHESAIVFPAIIAAYAFWLEGPAARADGAQGEPLLRRSVRVAWAAAPYVAAVLAYLALRITVLGFIARPTTGHVASWPQVFLSIPSVVWTYLMLLIVPWKAAPGHLFRTVTSAASAGFYMPALALCALVGAVLWLLRADSHRRLHLFLLVWMAIAVAPVLNSRVLGLNDFITDRYVYFSSVAFCIGLAALGAAVAERSQTLRSLVTAAAVALLVVYGATLWHVEGYWRNDVTLFGSMSRERPTSALDHARFGIALEESGDAVGALRELRRSVEIDPDQGPARYHLGRLYEFMGRMQDAEREMKHAFATSPGLPASFRLRLATVAIRNRDYAEADRALAQAARDPALANDVATVRADLLTSRGDLTGAEKQLRWVIGRNSADAPAWFGLGSVLRLEHRDSDAVGAFERAVALDPDFANARLRLAETLHDLGRDGDALAQARKVIAMRPRDGGAIALIVEIERARAADAPAR